MTMSKTRDPDRTVILIFTLTALACCILLIVSCVVARVRDNTAHEPDPIVNQAQPYFGRITGIVISNREGGLISDEQTLNAAAQLLEEKLPGVEWRAIDPDQGEPFDWEYWIYLYTDRGNYEIFIDNGYQARCYQMFGSGRGWVNYGG